MDLEPAVVIVMVFFGGGGGFGFHPGSRVRVE